MNESPTSKESSPLAQTGGENTKITSKEPSITRKRKKILNEIYETEKTYQHHLMLLTTLFLEPIKVSSVLPPRIIDGIFSNIAAIQSVSTHLMELMEEQGITQALIELAPFMKLYSLYANNFDHANKLLEEQIRKNMDFVRLLRFQENREEMQSLKFSALLVTPIQRVPRYRLLLQNLLEKTFEDDPDFSKLKDAYEKISSVATHINECVRLHENFHKMLAIQNSFTSNTAPKILAPGRLFIREGTVTKINENGSAKERTLFLFNDLLLIAKKETSCTYKCCDVYQLRHCIIEQVMGGKTSSSGLFRVICKDKSVLLCSKMENNSWPNDIKITVSKLHSNLASLRKIDGSVSEPDWKCGLEKKVKSPIKSLTSSSSSSRLKRLPEVNMARRHHGELTKRWTCLSDITSNMLCEQESKQLTQDDMFYGMSSSLSSAKEELPSISSIKDEVFERTCSNSNSNAASRKVNWTISEPSEVESRRPLHSLASGAKNIGEKIGCSSMKRKQPLDLDPSTSTYSKKKYRQQNSDGSLYKRIPDQIPISARNNPSNGCAIM